MDAMDKELRGIRLVCLTMLAIFTLMCATVLFCVIYTS